jgi:PAS domain S-box-containing protein
MMFNTDDDMASNIGFSPIATVLTDPRTPDNPIISVNAAFSRLTGYSEADVIGRNCRFLAGEKTEPWISKVLREAVSEGKPAFAELLNYRKDGTAFLNAVMIAPRFNDAGELQYFIGSQMDVSSEGTAISRRRRAGEAIRRLTPRQRDVLHWMAQGLRNKQIAVRLSINEKTVKMHRGSMLEKLGAATSADAVRVAVEAGL